MAAIISNKIIEEEFKHDSNTKASIQAKQIGSNQGKTAWQELRIMEGKWELKHRKDYGSGEDKSQQVRNKEIFRELSRGLWARGRLVPLIVRI